MRVSCSYRGLGHEDKGPGSGHVVFGEVLVQELQNLVGDCFVTLAGVMWCAVGGVIFSMLKYLLLYSLTSLSDAEVSSVQYVA